MPTGNLSQAEGVLRIVGGEYKVNYETSKMLFNRVNKGTGNALSDRGFEIPTEIEGVWNHGFPTDGGDWPAGGSITTIRPIVFFKEYAHSVRMTIRAITTIKPDTAYIKSWSDKNFDGALRAAYKMNNIYAWGTGNAVLGTISAGANSVTQTLNNTNNVRYLRYGMYVSVYDPTLSVVRGSATITSYPTPGQTTITLSSAINTTTSDVITVYGGANQAITGMQAIVDDTTYSGTIFQGINRNTYRNYRAQIINAGGDGLDVEILNRMIGAKIQIAMGAVDRNRLELWSYPSQTAAYASLGYNLKRAEMDSKSMDLGYTTYEFQGMNWVEEVDCAKTDIYYMDFDNLEKYVAKDWGWEDTDGHILRMVPSSTSGVAYKSQVEGYWTCDWNLGSPDPRPLGRITNLAVPSGY